MADGVLDGVTTDRDVGARLLRQLREGRGWSWADLSRALRDTARLLAITSLTSRQVASIQRTVARWESLGENTCPGDRYQLVLAHLYARTPSGDLALGPGSEFGALLDALRHFGTPPQRVRQLVELVAKGTSGADTDLLRLVSPAIQRASSRPDQDLLHQLRRSVAEINGQVGSTSFIRLQLQLAPVIDGCRRLLRLEHSDPRDELMLLAADAFALAARLAFETRDDEIADALYVDATRVAERLDDRSRLAAVRTSHAMVTLHATNDVKAARAIARAATVDAHRGASYAIRVRAHAVHAEICARAGQPDEAAVALDRAWKTADQLTIDDPHSGFTAEHLSGFDGLCALHAGDASRAHDNLDRSLTALMTSTNVVQRTIVSIDLALARLRLGDAVACVDLLHEAVDLTAATGSRVAAQRVRLTRRGLRPWRSEDFLTELDDHIHEALIGR